MAADEMDWDVPDMPGTFEPPIQKRKRTTSDVGTKIEELNSSYRGQLSSPTHPTLESEGIRVIAAGCRSLRNWFNGRHQSSVVTNDAMSTTPTKISAKILTVDCDGAQKHRALHISSPHTPDSNKSVTSRNNIRYNSLKRQDSSTTPRSEPRTSTSQPTTPTSGVSDPSLGSSRTSTSDAQAKRQQKPLLRRGSSDEKKQVRISLDEETGRPKEDVFILKELDSNRPSQRLKNIFNFSSSVPQSPSISVYGLVPSSIRPGADLTFSVPKEQPMYTPPRGRRAFDTTITTTMALESNNIKQEPQTGRTTITDPTNENGPILSPPASNLQSNRTGTIENGFKNTTYMPNTAKILGDDKSSVIDRISSLIQNDGVNKIGYEEPENDWETGFGALRISERGDAHQNREREKKEAEIKAKEEKKAREIAEKLEKELADASKRRKTTKPFIQDLSSDASRMLDDALAKGAQAALTMTLDGTQLRQKDLLTVLGNRSWLNDEVINGYLEHIVDHGNKTIRSLNNTHPTVVTFNSFFYAKLHKEGYKGVARWSKRKKINGTNLLHTDTILIPVNSNSHWTLLVVQPKKKTVEYLDSFGGCPDVYITDCFNWLRGELGKDFVEDHWQVPNTKSAVQRNGYDCGVFLLTNAECVTMGIDTFHNYSGADMAAQRRRIAAVLLNKGFGEMGNWE